MYLGTNRYYYLGVFILRIWLLENYNKTVMELISNNLLRPFH